MARVLVIDDNETMREGMAATVRRMGHEVDVASGGAAGLALFKARGADLVVTDLKMDGMSGMAVLEAVRDADPSVPTLIVTAHGNVETAVEAMRLGALDFLQKPFVPEVLRLKVQRALEVRGERHARLRAEAEAEALRSDAATPYGFAELVGRSPPMQAVFALVQKVAGADVAVHIHGESGTGKELVARAIHDCSARAGGPFVAVNCGAIPESLLEAEFFGYRKGAFTGADRDRDGFFQAAAGGTLFLDEVAELPLAMQVKLLRAIQERRVRKVGATAEEPVDVRLLSATHQDLNKLVGAGRFRQDLYYRLNVIELRVPSLRERAEDIGLIAEYLLQRLAERVDGKPPRLAPEARLALQRHSFPGNVRELENVLERALALATTDELQPLDLMLPQPEIDLLLEPELPEGVSGSAAPDADAPLAELTPESFAIIEGIPNNLPAYLDALERDAIRAAVVRTRNNRTAAAQLLGITFRQLRYRMQRLGLK